MEVGVDGEDETDTEVQSTYTRTGDNEERHKQSKQASKMLEETRHSAQGDSLRALGVLEGRELRLMT